MTVSPSATVHPTAELLSDDLYVGDHAYIGAGVRLEAPQIVVGDYTKIHARTFGYGKRPLRIGHNCWIGGGVTLDCQGGLTLNHGVGVGAGSQLWTHIRFGDVVQGCRWNKTRAMEIGSDAWFVGHCLVSPVRVEPRAMAMLGSVIVKDMRENHVYAGVPAEDVTGKVGVQFFGMKPWDKRLMMEGLIAEFENHHPQYADAVKVEQFDLDARTYKKTGDPAEVAFLKMHVPLVKFVPEGEERLW